ncbi:hypothetical protein [Occultella glacieicola]|uniref:hypothetical protein n=1 Tax=Occultella glacieicola TaxID=2518684 RepID=UPI001A9F62D1|nr:hypothetical protein [Occultella glacieicola]
MRRLVLLLPAGLALLAGLNGALLLLGVPAPVTSGRLGDGHGILLALGFVGTVVALERAVALRRPLALAAPALTGLGALALIVPAPPALGRALLVAGMLALGGICVPLWRRRREDAVAIQALGAVAGAGGAILWAAGVGMGQVLPWLTGFVVLTIAGERLELSRVSIDEAAGTRAGLLALAVFAVLPATLLWPAVGGALLGVALLALVGWLVVHDVARRTIRATGLVRFIAACLLAGYAWLALAGGIWLVAPTPLADGAYDAVIHAVFLGFTMSMIMAHAPVILPAVLGVRMPYHPVMVVAPSLLHASLLVRILGDARGSEVLREVGGLGNIAAVLVFVLVTVGIVVRTGSGRAGRTDRAGPDPSADQPAPALEGTP